MQVMTDESDNTTDEGQFHAPTRKCKYSVEQIHEMRSSGKPKPRDCSWEEWNQPRELRNHHYAMAYMSVSGVLPKEIAKSLNMTPQTVNKLLKTDRMAILCAKIRHKLMIENPKGAFVRVGSKAIDVNEKLMDSNKVKASTRAEIAKDFMDRAFGKPTQQVEVVGNDIRQILEAIQASKAQNPIDSQAPKANNVIENTPYTDLTEEKEVKEIQKLDDVDAWLKNNIK